MLGPMATGENLSRNRVKWYLWPLVPFGFAAAMIVMLPLGLLALLSIPYFLLYPDRHLHFADLHGSEIEKARVARWRATYSRLSFAGRVRRATRRIARGWLNRAERPKP